MKSDYKTPEQVEFTDLARELRERFNYNQNRLAEVCRMSAGMVSQVLSGKRSPGRPSLELLRREYRELTEPAPAGGPGRTEPDELREQLEDLKRDHPSAYEAAKLVVGTMHKQAVGGVSSKVGGAAVSSQGSASALARTESQASERRRGAGGPSGGKRGRGRGARRE